MQMYRGYQFHAEPYPGLGKAFVCAVEYLRLTEPDNKKKMDAIPQALEGNPANIGTLASEKRARNTLKWQHGAEILWQRLLWK